MKKILILSASPRREGNSDRLCMRFMEGALSQQHEVKKIFLRDKHIEYCIGCDACKKNGTCVYHDDMAEILKEMISADVIVMASPVYFYTINAQLKTLIDRMVARYTEIRNKEFYFILSAAENDKASMERTVECFRGFIDCLDGAKEREVIYGIGAWNFGDIEGTEAMQQAYEAGRNV